MKFTRAAGRDPRPVTLKAKALAIGARRRNLTILVFGLDPEQEAEQVAQDLQKQLNGVQLTCRVRSAGPERVRAVLDGKFSEVDVLVVLGEAANRSEASLMELVEWLLANSRPALAENLVYAQCGEDPPNTPAPVFTRVVLPARVTSLKERNGLRFPWAVSTRESMELAHAVLDYATGLEAE